MKTIRSEDQGQGDDVVSHQFLEILSWLLEAHEQDNHLLCPVCRLREVVCLENSVVCLVRESLKHAGSIEVPDWGPGHDIQSQGSQNGKVYGSIGLLHEAGLFRSRLQSGLDGQRAQ